MEPAFKPETELDHMMKCSAVTRLRMVLVVREDGGREILDVGSLVVGAHDERAAIEARCTTLDPKVGGADQAHMAMQRVAVRHATGLT